MRGPFLASLGLHVVVCVAMVWASGARTSKLSPLPSSTTVVKLIRPMSVPGTPQAAPPQKGQPPESEPPMTFPDKTTGKKPQPTTNNKPKPNTPQLPKTQPGPPGAGGKELKGAAGTLSIQGGGFDYDFYLAVVQSKIEKNFRPPPGLRSQNTSTVYFKIEKDGTICGVNLAKPSGNVLIDNAAIRAIRAAGMFPPLPAQYDKGELEIYFEFVVNAAGTR
jgi:protein TonB